MAHLPPPEVANMQNRVRALVLRVVDRLERPRQIAVPVPGEHQLLRLPQFRIKHTRFWPFVRLPDRMWGGHLFGCVAVQVVLPFLCVACAAPQGAYVYEVHFSLLPISSYISCTQLVKSLAPFAHIPRLNPVPGPRHRLSAIGDNNAPFRPAHATRQILTQNHLATHPQPVPIETQRNATPLS